MLRYFGGIAISMFVFLAGCGSSPEPDMQSESKPSEITGKADIFGEDSRHEYYELASNSELRSAADATAMIVDTFRILNKYDDGKVKIERKDDIGQKPLCREARFSEQPRIGECSAVLVDDDLVATAGHCVHDSCTAEGFAFGTYIQKSGDDPTIVPEDNIYECEKIVRKEYEMFRASTDYALIRLDREVEDREPLTLRGQGQPKQGTPIGTIGSPIGLPLKFSNDSKVLDPRPDKDFFAANLDVAGGNSGGPVINLEDGRLEGLLVRGKGTDESQGGTIDRGSCLAWSKCEEATANTDSPECYGNHVQEASAFAEYINSERNDSSGEDCCRVCTQGKPCGDTCIENDASCNAESGCACGRGE
jgi:V8-like Glu-specific endopeptidase